MGIKAFTKLKIWWRGTSTTDKINIALNAISVIATLGIGAKLTHDLQHMKVEITFKQKDGTVLDIPEEKQEEKDHRCTAVKIRHTKFPFRFCTKGEIIQNLGERMINFKIHLCGERSGYPSLHAEIQRNKNKACQSRTRKGHQRKLSRITNDALPASSDAIRHHRSQ